MPAKLVGLLVFWCWSTYRGFQGLIRSIVEEHAKKCQYSSLFSIYYIKSAALFLVERDVAFEYLEDRLAYTVCEASFPIMIDIEVETDSKFSGATSSRSRSSSAS